MFLEKRKNTNNTYILLLENFKYFKDGKKKYQKKLIKSLGNIDVLSNGNPNFFEELKEAFNNGIALIPELEEYVTVKNDTYIEKNIGYRIIIEILRLLGITHSLTRIKSRNKINLDIVGLTQLLISNRTLEPSSKLSAFESKDSYLEEITTSKDFRDIYKVLDVLNDKKDSIITTMNTNISKMINRDLSLTYYDVTNYYFETEITDELKKVGVSKENRKTPIVQMGMFMDNNSIPLGYDIFPGNTLDNQTLKPAMDKYIKEYNLNNILIVADKGMLSNSNEINILNDGNNYLFAKSIRKSNSKIKDWVLDNKGYIVNSNNSFKYKSQIIEREVKDKEGNTHIIKEKLLVYWSEDYYRKELFEKEKFLETLNKYADNPHSIPAGSKKGLDKYIVKTYADKKTGEVIRPLEIREVDITKFEKEKELMGYYILSTSKLDMEDVEMIDKYKALVKIEDCFRILKSDLDARPIYVRTKEHINAHFLICFIALTIIKLLQHKIKEKREVNGLSARRIQKALKELKIIRIQEYALFKNVDEDLFTIFKALNIENNLNIQLISELKSSIRKLEI